MYTENIIRILTYIIIYSFFGWILESIYKTILQKKFINSGFLNGPVCPIYGFGAMIMLFTLSFLKNNIILLFITSFIALSIWEYIAGLILEKLFNVKYWDYSNYRFNIHGRVCLLNSIFWGVLGVVFIKFVHPFVEGIVVNIPLNVLLILNIVLYIVLFTDIIISSVRTLKLNDAISRIEQIEANIKEKIEELKIEYKNKSSKSIKDLEKVIRNLKLEQTRLKLKLYRTAKRLKDAFPTMKSDSISNFMSEKIDLESLKLYIKKLKAKIINK